MRWWHPELPGKVLADLQCWLHNNSERDPSMKAHVSTHCWCRAGCHSVVKICKQHICNHCSVPGIGIGASVGATMGGSVGEFVGGSVGGSVGASVGDAVGGSVGGSVGASVRGTVGASVGRSGWASVGGAVGGLSGDGATAVPKAAVPPVHTPACGRVSSRFGVKVLKYYCKRLWQHLSTQCNCRARLFSAFMQLSPRKDRCRTRCCTCMLLLLGAGRTTRSQGTPPDRPMRLSN